MGTQLMIFMGTSTESARSAGKTVAAGQDGKVKKYINLNILGG